MTILLLVGFPEAPLQGVSGYRDMFTYFYMPPGAPTCIAQNMDNLLGLSLSPSLQILPSQHLCQQRKWAAKNVVFTRSLTPQMLGG